jgi:undecaprenyl-diphosphatase
MELLQAIVLGAVQGLTEFLPISSSGHLVLIPWFFHWKDLGQTFDVALHLGTLLALLFYFWRDWLSIIRRWREPLLWFLLIGCVPAAVFGYLFEDYFETVFRSPVIISVLVIVFGLVLYYAERRGRKVRDLSSVNLGDALFIGFAQALALMPGVSRSGITITAGLFAGMKRETAARFSFLLSMPIVAGAGVLKMRNIFQEGMPGTEAVFFIVGILTSAVFGFLTIKFLLNYLQRHSFGIFVWYRIAFGAAMLLAFFLRSHV